MYERCWFLSKGGLISQFVHVQCCVWRYDQWKNIELKNMFTKLEMLQDYQGMKIQITVKLHMVYDTTDMHHMWLSV